MIEIEKISKTFDSDLLKKPFKALDQLSFEIPSEKIIGFLGANGAGKTTLIKILMDFIRPSSGKIIFNESIGKNPKDIFRNIGYLPERPYFYPTLTGDEFLDYLANISDVSKKDKVKNINYWAPRFKIDFALNRAIKTYSKGMLQRLGFLASLIHDPKIIILDEPLSGLDPVGRKELKDVMLQINSEGKTVFFSSHIVSDVEEVCQNVIFIKEGQLVYQGIIEDLIEKHTKADIVLKYWSDNKIVEFVTKDKDLFKKLDEIKLENGKIHSITPKRLTLEEIIYKV